jgi:hypothetical protein
LLAGFLEFVASDECNDECNKESLKQSVISLHLARGHWDQSAVARRVLRLRREQQSDSEDGRKSRVTARTDHAFIATPPVWMTPICLNHCANWFQLALFWSTNSPALLRRECIIRMLARRPDRG